MLRQCRSRPECEQEETSHDRQQPCWRISKSFNEIIAGAGQDHQYGGSRKDQVAPSAPEKLCDEITGKNQSARNARSPQNRVRADPYDGVSHPKYGSNDAHGASA